MRWLRVLRNPAALLVLVPIAALVTLSYVGPGSSEPLRDGHAKSDKPATSVVPVDPAAASQAAPAAVASDVPNPDWADTYDGTAASSRRRSPAAVAAASEDRSTTTTTEAAPVAPLAAAAAEVPPDAVVKESSSPIVLILVAVGVVLVALGGFTFWRRRRATA